MPNVIIPKAYERKRSLVAIPKKEYSDFLAYRQELRSALTKIARSRAEFHLGTTQVITSLSELR